MTGALPVAEAVDVIAAERGDAMAVLTMSGMGVWPQQREDDFRLVGLMGSAASIGLGVALGRPDRDVWVVDGDGSLLMQLGVLAAISDAAPPRLLHLVIANDVYAISGGQAVPGPPRWEALALAAGYRSAIACSDAGELRAALRAPGASGPRMVVVHCSDRRPDFAPGVFAVDPNAELERVRAALERTPPGARSPFTDGLPAQGPTGPDARDPSPSVERKLDTSPADASVGDPAATRR